MCTLRCACWFSSMTKLQYPQSFKINPDLPHLATYMSSFQANYLTLLSVLRMRRRIIYVKFAPPAAGEEQGWRSELWRLSRFHPWSWWQSLNEIQNTHKNCSPCKISLSWHSLNYQIQSNLVSLTAAKKMFGAPLNQQLLLQLLL